MPPVTPRQQRFMGADLNRAEEGKKTKTGMSKEKLRDWASKPKGGYPGKKSGNGNGRNGRNGRNGGNRNARR